ncbi:MAG: DUF4445 domain-containing protein [Deltaproteobacteria bacterium]|jgi:uncharacterized 2Fe-2S/4Fe-4S cluster protein (DUF4445 family)|nr:DUF4445 domain-containing protein [Deltaproteobacteria bacterium]
MNEKTTPWIQIVQLNVPSLADNTADAERLLQALKSQLNIAAVDIDLTVLKTLPKVLRDHDFNIRCVLFKEKHQWVLTDIQDARDTQLCAGLAIDLGTSRVVLRLVDLASGRPMAESAFDNPQETIGPDVLSRIHFAEKEDALEHLNTLIVSGLNSAIAQLCDSQQLTPEHVYALTVAGNTTMTHLFMGLNPRWLIREPYIPVTNNPGVVRAATLGLGVNPRARVLIFPNIGSYFGGDLIAGALFSGIYQSSETCILVDVGTNAEVLLGNKNWLIACAGAAGPALEGGVTRMGMTAGPGVIDQIKVDATTLAFDIHTIDNLPPTGICGSGVIDLAAQLFLSNMIDIRGRLVPAVCGSKLKIIDGLSHLVVVPAENSATGADLTISQADLDSLMRSKAAMYTILETITGSVGLTPQELHTFYVAGTFGSFINPESAISIGMLPDLPRERYQSLGNSSLGGATLALESNTYHEEINRIRERITYLELNVNQDFMNRFSAAKFLPHTNTKLFPSVKAFQASA